MNINVQTIHFQADERLNDFISRKMKKLDTLGYNIQRAELMLRYESGLSFQDKHIEVRLTMAGAQLFTKQTASSYEAGIEKAIDILRNQIRRYRGKQVVGKRRKAMRE